jgi:uncharacterized protein DUF5818
LEVSNETRCHVCPRCSGGIDQSAGASAGYCHRYGLARRPGHGLYDGKEFYTLSDQRTPEKFAGKKVRVTGTLNAKTKTIQVDSITAEK